MSRNEFEQARAFIEGAKTGIDWLNHKGRCRESSPPEYEEGFRHALDAIGGYFDHIDEENGELEAQP
jgi:hypothetical protein